MIENEIEQRSLDWYRIRLGNITGSRVGDLMKSGRKKDEVFGETAKSYLLQLAAERMMNPVVVENDDVFQQYVDATNVTSKAMRFGTEQEEFARDIFEKRTGVTVDEVSSCKHDSIPHFAASPDGIIFHDMRPVACVEIKCPKQEAFMRYATQIHDAQTLKEVMPQYYWQVQAEMECTGTDLCYFIAYSPWQLHPLHVCEILKNEADCETLRERVNLANKYIQDIIDHGTESGTALSAIRDTVQRRAADRIVGMAEWTPDAF